MGLRDFGTCLLDVVRQHVQLRAIRYPTRGRCFEVSLRNITPARWSCRLGAPDRMVTAVDIRWSQSIHDGWQLPEARLRIKVEKSLSRSLRSSPRWPLPEVKPVTSRLRELIQQLGEAIHESVIESEQIAGVVQDIRKHGFDVLLMLEATIGLNEVKEGENAEAGADGENSGAFTKNDVNFLRSLRISIEGEENNENQAG